MGHAARSLQDVDEILGRFGRRAGTARKHLVEFMSDLRAARKEEHLFKGGGLIRSAGGMEQLQQMPREERQMYDERILGDGQFVEAVLKKAERQDQPTAKSGLKSEKRLAVLQKKVCQRLKIGRDNLRTGGRARQAVRARIIVAYVAGRYLGWSGRELAKRLGISPSSVSRSIGKGEEEIHKLGWDVDELIT
jgi:hypothetical protein